MFCHAVCVARLLQPLFSTTEDTASLFFFFFSPFSRYGSWWCYAWCYASLAPCRWCDTMPTLYYALAFAMLLLTHAAAMICHTALLDATMLAHNLIARYAIDVFRLIADAFDASCLPLIFFHDFLPPRALPIVACYAVFRLRRLWYCFRYAHAAAAAMLILRATPLLLSPFFDAFSPFSMHCLRSMPLWCHYAVLITHICHAMPFRYIMMPADITLQAIFTLPRLRYCCWSAVADATPCLAMSHSYVCRY